MSRNRTTTIFFVAILVMFASNIVLAYELYHWVDEDGVANYTQDQPADTTPGVRKLTLEDAPDNAPVEELYDVQAHAERMAAFREEKKQRRTETLERQRRAAEQQVVQVIEPVRHYANPFWYPPRYYKPRPKPQPPVAEPRPTSTLKLPGKSE